MAKGSIRRYTLIYEKVDSGNFPSFESIRGFLNKHEMDVSDRTIQRDIEQIRKDFGVEILYDREKNGYYINPNKSLGKFSFPHFLEIANTAELLTESLKESSNSLEHISFDSPVELSGIEYLKPLLFAIKNHRKITFKHKNFITEKQTSHNMQPYLLKQYQNRWYLIGQIDGMKEFSAYGLESLSDLEVREQSFKPDKRMGHPKTLFDKIVGLTYSIDQSEEILLALTPLQCKYVKSIPLHSSQKIVQETADECLVSLHLIPNYEFKQKIMMMGEQVKVIEPSWLAEDVRLSLEAALKNYEN